jgi:hypothetical protein
MLIIKDIKPQPNHAIYLEVLRKMTPEQRLMRAFELSEFTRELFREGLRQRFPEKNESEIHILFLEKMKQCYNRDY